MSDFEDAAGEAGLNPEDTLDIAEVVEDDDVLAPEIDDALPLADDDGALGDTDGEEKEGEGEDEEFMSYMYGEDVLNER
ncbi:MAG: hypothetical protein ABIO57_00755 [Candidatus Paceibacterota bacterium]